MLYQTIDNQIQKTINLDKFCFSKEAKTPSFFALGGFLGVSEEMIGALVNLGEYCGETVRYCLHNSPQDSLHIMLIYHPHKKSIPEHIFENTDSYYILQKGQFNLINLETQEVILVGCADCKIAKIAKGVPYKMEILSESVLFIEVRERNRVSLNQNVAGGGGHNPLFFAIQAKGA